VVEEISPAVLNCFFASCEILVKGNARFGPGARLQSVAVDGDLTLGWMSKVARWLDSTKELTIGANCSGGRASHIHRAHPFGTRCTGCLDVCTASRHHSVGWELSDSGNSGDAKLPAVAFSEEAIAARESIEDAGFDVKRLIRLERIPGYTKAISESCRPCVCKPSWW